MKTLVLFVFLLTIVYAINPDELKSFHENYTGCATELGAPEKKRADVVRCLLQREGLINDENVFMTAKAVAQFVDIISDAAKIEQATEILHNCYDHAYEGPGNNDEKTMKAVECALPIMDLIDTP